MRKIITRRSILRGMFAAPAIIAIDRLMPVKAYASIIKRDPNVVWYRGIMLKDESFFYCPYIPLETTWFHPNPVNAKYITTPNGIMPL